MDTAGTEELEHFRNIRWLHNHWSRPVSPPAYYWYLTFENRLELHSFVRECQQRISFPYYDLTPPRDLHLTLDRVAYSGAITSDQLGEIVDAALMACSEIPPFDVTVGSMGGTPGAVGFTVSSAQPVRELRDALRAATLSSYPLAPVRGSTFHPHVAIAYANSDNISATEVIEVVEELNAIAHVKVTVTHATLVLLERRPNAYAWQSVSQIPLSG